MASETHIRYAVEYQSKNGRWNRYNAAQGRARGWLQTVEEAQHLAERLRGVGTTVRIVKREEVRTATITVVG